MAGLATRLSDRGHDVSLLTLVADGEHAHEVGPKVHRTCLNLTPQAKTPFGKFLQIRRRHRLIDKAIQSIAPEVVLSFCDRMNLDILSARSEEWPPVVVSERSDPAAQKLGFVRERLRRKLYPRSNCIVALTETAASFLRKFNSNVFVIPSAVELPVAVSDRVIAQSNKTVVGAGRLESEKAFDRLLRAFALATESHRDWRLIVYGEGTQRDRLQETAAELRIDDRFELPGMDSSPGPGTRDRDDFLYVQQLRRVPICFA